MPATAPAFREAELRPLYVDSVRAPWLPPLGAVRGGLGSVDDEATFSDLQVAEDTTRALDYVQGEAGRASRELRLPAGPASAGPATAGPRNRGPQGLMSSVRGRRSLLVTPAARVGSAAFVKSLLAKDAIGVPRRVKRLGDVNGAGAAQLPAPTLENGSDVTAGSATRVDLAEGSEIYELVRRLKELQAQVHEVELSRDDETRCAGRLNKALALETVSHRHGRPPAAGLDAAAPGGRTFAERARAAGDERRAVKEELAKVRRERAALEAEMAALRRELEDPSLGKLRGQLAERYIEAAELRYKLSLDQPLGHREGLYAASSAVPNNTGAVWMQS